MNYTKKTFILIILLSGLSFSQQSVMDDQGFYLMCEKMPELIGGMDGLQKKIKYPLQAKTLGVQGVVYVQAIINEEGIVDSSKLVKKLGA